MSRIKQYIPAIAAVLMVLIGLGLSFYQKETTQEQYRKNYIDAFDTVTTMIGYGDSQEDVTAKTDVLMEELKRYHKLYDIYNSYDGINNLKTINDNAGIAPVKVDKEIIDLLKFSIDLYDKTNGQTNIALGKVLRIWHDYRNYGIDNPSEADLPPMDNLEEAAKHCDITNIIIDEEASTVYLNDPEMSLDVGSIGKGYAVQKVSEYARELGYEHMVISVGGNISVIGPKADESLWKFGVQNPDLESEQASIASVTLVDTCLVTSGDYQRYYVVDGIEYCHIIDPDTLMPADYCKAVTVITPHSGEADALSTALFCMSYEEGLEHINSIPDAEAMWVLEDGSIQYSANFESYLAK
ncbi:MAG: FAD:protein FMN transferase [Agathobacter sp.]|nr:FAD:protein FMN transferase [Agathobacter sp.]